MSRPSSLCCLDLTFEKDPWVDSSLRLRQRVCRWWSVISPSEMPSKNRKSKKNNNGSKGGIKLRPNPPLSDHRRCKLTFCSPLNLAESAAGTGAYNFYRMNGPYDPDTAVLSASTPGLAAIAQLYRSMRVWAVDIGYSGTVAGLGAHMATIVPTAFQPVLPSNTAYWPVQRLAVSKPALACGTTTAQNIYAFDVRAHYNLNDVLNITRSQYLDESDYSSTTTANPTRQVYFAVAHSSVTSSITYVQSYIRITYDLEFFDPYPLQ